MAGTLKKLVFVRAWSSYSVGATITPNGTLRDFLLARGFCRLADEVEAPARPAKMSAKAAAKVASGARAIADKAAGLFKFGSTEAKP